MNEMVWKEEFNVGCDYVDDAHRKLFSILRKVQELLVEKDYEKNKHACVEAIKYLYNYTATHFAQEEAFMRERNYEGYEFHKKLHDDMRENTVPSLDRELEESDYSREAIEQFIGVFSGWLAGHILIEDRAITGKVKSKWQFSGTDECDASLDAEIEKLVGDVSGIQMSLVSKHYDGTPFENAFCYEMEYSKTKVIFVAQKPFVIELAGSITSSPLKVFDKTVVLTFAQFAQSVSKEILLITNENDNHDLIGHRSITIEDIKNYYEDAAFLHSMKWKTPAGYAALCVVRK